MQDGQVAYLKIGIPIWRMLDDLGGYCPWGVVPGFGVDLTMRDRPIINVCRELMKPEIFFTKQLYRNFYAGSDITLDFCFINDSLLTGKYKITWEAFLYGKKIAGDNFSEEIKPAENVWEKISFTAPSVEKREELDINIKMSKNDQIVHKETLSLNIYPRSKSLESKIKTIVIDSNGKTCNALKRNGVKFEKVLEIIQALSMKPELIIIGENSVTAETAFPAELDEFVKNGGKVVMLAQENPKAYAPLSRPNSDSKRTRSIVFACDASHPLLEGISREELLFWNHPEWDKAHSVAVNAQTKFGRGNIHAILDCDSLWFSPLQELKYGKGLYIECSLDLIEKNDSEPIASKVLANIFKYIENWRVPVYKQLFILRDSKIAEIFNKQGILCSNLETVSQNGIVLITDSSRLNSDDIPKLKVLAENAGTVWLHAGKGADIAKFAELTGLKIKVEPYPANPHCREVRRTEKGRSSKILSGISSAALYDRATLPNLWKIEGSEELATAGAVVHVPIGKGDIIIERLAWESPANLAQQQWADHFLHSFATNLGVEIDIYRNAKRRIFKTTDFITLDLRQVCNRGFRDEVAGDGQGGWTDQGPNNDLRGMKTGPQNYHQVTFDIIEPSLNDGKSCIVLHSEKHAPTCPTETAEISVGAKVKSIFFLHTAAWFDSVAMKDKPIINYVINYEDGTCAVVPALGSKNIKDWWTPGNCEESLGVSLLLKSDTESDALPRRRGL